ncbi:MAG: hypothetical protein V1731_00020 [Candidatus Aenigmatarchaeota archaeon]
MTLKKFEEFVKAGTVKRQTPNRERALSILKESGEKKSFLDVSMKSIPPERMSANFVVCYCYDILVELIRAKMFIDGYNAGGSHEAEVSYMAILGFPDADVRFMDDVRYYRNGTKYYGTVLDMEYAGKVVGFMNRIYPKLAAMVK